MRDELILRGIPAGAIQMEYRGLNTHQQALKIFAMLSPAATHEPLLIVSSNFHLRRALLCFRKAGFTKVAVRPALVRGVTADKISGDRGTRVRYSLWNRLRDEVDIARELVALLVYKSRGWI
jgi:uncharacterized SAM-binding protein YcdF (DUF218 family)